MGDTIVDRELQVLTQYTRQKSANYLSFY